MKKLINMTVFNHDMDRFENQDALKDFYKSRGLDGLELQAEGKFLNQSGLRGLFLFAEDEKPRRDRLTANTLSEPRLLHYYLEAEKDWE